MPVLEAVLDLDGELGALLRERWEADLAGVDVPRQAIPPPPCTTSLTWVIAGYGRAVAGRIWRGDRHYLDLAISPACTLGPGDSLTLTLYLRRRPV
jgi:hypothetical protein